MKNALKWFLLYLMILVSHFLFARIARADEVRPTRSENVVSIELVLFDSKPAVIEKCKSLGAWPQFDAAMVERLHRAPGCNVFYPETKRCIIFTLSPRFLKDYDRMENLGHETLHCFKGDYHD